MAAQGQSAFSCAGDRGAYAAYDDLGTTNLSVASPTDSPFITSAGGTTLPLNSAVAGPQGTFSVTVPTERAWGWDYLWQPIASAYGESLLDAAESYTVGGGRGFSAFEPTPSYQHNVPGVHAYHALPYLTPVDTQQVQGVAEPTDWTINPRPRVISGTGTGRAVPDLSANADPESGYPLYAPSLADIGQPALQGGWGGTSFVAPQLNGAAAVINSYLGHRIGLWNPRTYPLATHASSPFMPLDQAGVNNDNLYYTGNPGQPYNQSTGLVYPTWAGSPKPSTHRRSPGAI